MFQKLNFVFKFITLELNYLVAAWDKTKIIIILAPPTKEGNRKQHHQKHLPRKPLTTVERGWENIVEQVIFF